MALPAGMPVAALLPAIVELAGQPPSESPQGWRLDRIGGPTMDELITLGDNDVHDGDILVLAPSDAPPLGLLQWDPCRTVAEAGSSPDAGSVRSEVSCVWAAVVGSLALCWGAAGQLAIHLLIAAIGTCTAAGFAIAGRSAAPGLASVPLAAAAGFLAVPSGPGAANVFLAAVAAATMSLLMLRWVDDGSSTLAATACFSTLVAVTGVAPVVGAVPVATVGAALTVVALGALAVSGPHLDSAVRTGPRSAGRRDRCACSPRPRRLDRPGPQDAAVVRRSVPSSSQSDVNGTARRARQAPDSAQWPHWCYSYGSARTPTQHAAGCSLSLE